MVAAHLAVATVELESAGGGWLSASGMTLVVLHRRTIQLRERLPLHPTPLDQPAQEQLPLHPSPPDQTPDSFWKGLRR